MFHVNSARSITPPKIPSANLNVWIINKFLTLFGSPYVIIGKFQGRDLGRVHLS
jgi:hypothetical protein